jgi:hypothetical protein
MAMIGVGGPDVRFIAVLLTALLLVTYVPAISMRLLHPFHR